MSFVSDLNAGAGAEEEFVELLRSLKIKAGRNSSKNTKELALYDVWDEHYDTYEVKRDRQSGKTGNVFLEHDSILRSVAKYVVFKLDGDENFYIADSPTAHTLLNKHRTVTAGYPQVTGTLVPVQFFKETFRIVDKGFKKEKVGAKALGKKTR